MNIIRFRFLGYDKIQPEKPKAKMHAIITIEKGIGPFRKRILKRVHSFYELKNGIKQYHGTWYDSKSGKKCSSAVSLAYHDWARENVEKKS